MVFEITVGAGAAIGIWYRISKIRARQKAWPETPPEWSARVKVFMWLHVLAFVGLIGKFDTFESGLMFGLIFVGAMKLTEELAEAAIDSYHDLRS